MCTYNDLTYFFTRDRKPDKQLKAFYYVYRKDSMIHQGILDVNLPEKITVHNGILYFPRPSDSWVGRCEIQEDCSLKEMEFIEFKNGGRQVRPFNNNVIIHANQGGSRVYDGTELQEVLLNDIEINNSLVDRQGNIWLGSASKGLFLKNKSYIDCVAALNVDPSLSPSVLYAYGEKLIIGYDNLNFGIFEEDKLASYRLREENWSGKIRGFAELGKNELLAATHSGLYSFDLNTKKSEKYFTSTLKCIVQRNVDDYFIGASSQFLRFYRQDTLSILSERTTALYYDDSDKLWRGTLYGLWAIENLEEGQFYEKENLLSGTIINDITGQKDVVYVATSNGVCIISNSVIKCLTIEDGLVGDNCVSLKYYDNKLFVATSSGLSIMYLNKGNQVIRVENFTEYDGLISNTLSDIEIYQGQLYIASNSGICKMTLDKPLVVGEPHTNIVSASADDNEIILSTNNSLKPKTQTIQINFSGMSYGFDGQDIDFQYKLEPIIKNWTKTDNNSLNFSGLDPLDYKFSVQAINKKGVLSENIARLNFSIEPTFVQSAVFKFLVGLLGAFLLWSVFRFRTAIAKREQENATKISELELDAIKAQINPHFIYNCLNSIKNTVAKGETLSAEKQISIFAKLIRQTLNNSKENYISLDDEMEYLQNYLEMEKLRFKDKLDYVIQSDNELLNKTVKVPAMLIQPYVENAVKYGMQNEATEQTKIQVSFKKEGRKLICEVEDNGPGIQATQNVYHGNKKSYGMRISSARAKTYNEIFKANIDITASDKKEIEQAGSGTLITIKMNLNEQ